MIAKSAADKLFEMKVDQRRNKKAVQAEAAAVVSGSGDEKAETDMKMEDKIDYFVVLQDYPCTAAEALAFSQYGQTLHCFFEIYQVQETNEGAAPADLKAAKEVVCGSKQAAGDDSEVKHYESVRKQIAELKSAVARSAKTAPVRQ